ncbi:hypothetical protein O6H91_09G016900 [Diphasiastrum complanatum]|uniref:Uncharacterized protein n=4 Tax=Diphasiastrum complanatum TaxID=34168 RepID=A0ACC2CLS2_DIPCM|nr:hypothetical protein O6H91_09G016500 [Diphasiastrum complanatum]KAJ7542901.1 hypothetical protein O6H91_09G016500 [Diphasiastrum complanatum]KAJ7542902.1 hypothetical protein O6H91_09G016500 [Diphasiastrum complanatum]KAJ7542911.1 hypothetical protein O6H91_09G016900 [Diphasiastrum complanatum]
MPVFSRQGSPSPGNVSERKFDSDDESMSSRSSSQSYIRSSGIAPFPKSVRNSGPHFKQETHNHPGSSNPFDDDELPKAASKHNSKHHHQPQSITSFEHEESSTMETKARHSTGHSKKSNPTALASGNISDEDKNLPSKSRFSTKMKNADSDRLQNSDHGNPNSRDLLLESGSNSRYKGARKPVLFEAQEQADGHFPRFQQMTGDLEQQSQQELESYAITKSEETTATIYNALKIAEGTKEVATKTTIQIHAQGEQIRRTHDTAVIVDMELKRGEKLLGSLGGLFSKKWRPKSNRAIAGPVTGGGKAFKSKAYALEQRAALGLKHTNSKSRNHTSVGDELPLQSRLQVEIAKQDDALSDLSNLVVQLKEMSLDIGREIERQGEGIDNLHDDVEELNFRLKGANERGRKLLYS